MVDKYQLTQRKINEHDEARRERPYRPKYQDNRSAGPKLEGEKSLPVAQSGADQEATSLGMEGKPGGFTASATR